MENYVIVRGNRSGVFFGVLDSRIGREVKLLNARKLYYWDGAGAVQQLAVDGVSKPEKCKFTVYVSSIEILDVIEIIPCSLKSIKSIKGVKEWIM